MADTRSRADLIDPASLAALGRIEIIARWVVEGFLTGLHRSPRKGFSVEFAEHRAYQPGDDLRFLDWKVVARADKWLIKQFEEETNLKATIVLDVSKSMAWSGAPGATHQARVRRAGRRGRRVAAAAPARRRRAHPFRRRGAHRDPAARPLGRSGAGSSCALEDPGSGKGSDARGRARCRPRSSSRRPGMVVVISDLLVDEDEMAKAVSVLRAVGHDVTVLHILDPAERDLAIAKTETELIDTETAASVNVMLTRGARRVSRDGAGRDRRVARPAFRHRRRIRARLHRPAVRRGAAPRVRRPPAPAVSFLAPFALVLAGAAAVPLVLHLLRRRTGEKVDFPAIRYLLRAEREHSRQLKLRNLLLMLLRVCAVLALALAAARPIGRLAGGSHAPTAIAIVLDNSLSTSVVVNGAPVLARLKDAARAAVGRANAARPALARHRRFARGRRQRGRGARRARSHRGRSPGRATSRAAVARATQLVRGGGLPSRQIAVLTDAQATSWAAAVPLDGVATTVFAPGLAPPKNRVGA